MPVYNNETGTNLAGAAGAIVGSTGAVLASAATLVVTDTFHTVTGAVVINTIDAQNALRQGSFLCLRCPAGATWTLGVAGNIKKAIVPGVGEAVLLAYDGTDFWPVHV